MKGLIELGWFGKVCAIPTGCTDPAVTGGPFCARHGCTICGGVILADTEDWNFPLCYYHFAGPWVAI